MFESNFQPIRLRCLPLAFAAVAAAQKRLAPQPGSACFASKILRQSVSVRDNDATRFLGSDDSDGLIPANKIVKYCIGEVFFFKYLPWSNAS